MENQTKNKAKDNNKNALYNMLFSIVIPVIILNKLSSQFGEDGPLIALLVALAFPIGYSLYEFRSTRKLNPISVLGFVNVLATGGLALMQLEGIWFAVKEGMFPLIIGIAVYLSSGWKKPLIKVLLFNDQVFDVHKIQDKLGENNSEQDFDDHLRKSTKYFAYTFYLSAILNFALASYIFTEIPLELPSVERSQILNEQIADMTWKSYFVIVIPSMLCMFVLLSYLLKGIKRYTGLDFQDVLHQPEPKKQ